MRTGKNSPLLSSFHFISSIYVYSREYFWCLRIVNKKKISEDAKTKLNEWKQIFPHYFDKFLFFSYITSHHIPFDGKGKIFESGSYFNLILIPPLADILMRHAWEIFRLFLRFRPEVRRIAFNYFSEVFVGLSWAFLN